MFLQLIILSMESICIIILNERIFGTKSSRYSHEFVIALTNRFNLGHLY